MVVDFVRIEDKGRRLCRWDAVRGKRTRIPGPAMAVGLDLVRVALSLALENNLAAPAAEIYQRLADSLEHTGDYNAARATYEDALLGLAGLTHAPSATWTADRAYTVGRPRFFGHRPLTVVKPFVPDAG